jgi:hypothetical protein
LASALAQDTQPEAQPSSAPAPSPSYAPIPSAQSAPASASGYFGMPPATPFAGTSQLAVAPTTPLEAALGAVPNFLRWGPIAVRPHLTYDLSYGNTLQTTPGERSSTLINTVAPGVLFALGDHWSLDYTPTLRFYGSPQFKDGVDHFVTLNGGAQYREWIFGVSQSYASTSQPLIETASFTDQEVYGTTLTAGHTLGGKMSIDLSANQNFRFVDQGSVLEPVVNTREWSTMDWLNYQFVPRLTAGLGVGFTYDNMSFGSDMTSEQFQGRINWHATDKLSLLLSGGLDYRQFLSSDIPDLLSPIFSAAIQYQLFEPTSLSLSASRSTSPSYFQNALTEVSSVSASVHQRLLRRLFLDVSGGYSSTAYHNTATVVSAAQTSDYDSTSVNVRLSMAFLRRASAAIYFQENFLSSSSKTAAASLYNYSTTQYGLSLAYRF